MFANIRSAQDRVAQAGGRQLGSLLWWQLSGTRVDHQRLVAAAERHGLDARYLPAELKPVQAFRRAWRHATSKLSDGLMLRPITETSDEITIGLVCEKPNEARRDLDYDLLCRITFHKESARITADAGHGITEDVRALYSHHLAHTTEDARLMMTAFLGEAGVSLRDAGGVYFVPEAHADQLTALCGVVEEVGHNKTFRLPIVDTPATRLTLRTVAERSLDDEVRELEEELAGFDLTKVRESTLERRLEAFGQLRSRAGLFANVLAFKADGLSKRVASMEAQVRLHLGLGPTAAPTSAPTTPTLSPAMTMVDPDIGF